MTPNAASFLLAQQSKNSAQHHYNPATTGTSPMDMSDMDMSEGQSNCDHHNNDGSSELVFNGMMGIQPQSFMMLPSVMMDPSLLQQFPILNLPTATMTSGDNAKSSEGNSVVKEIIHCTSCTLIPPNPTAPAPTTRDKPLGCKSNQ